MHKLFWGGGLCTWPTRGGWGVGGHAPHKTLTCSEINSGAFPALTDVGWSLCRVYVKIVSLLIMTHLEMGYIQSPKHILLTSIVSMLNSLYSRAD